MPSSEKFGSKKLKGLVQFEITISFNSSKFFYHLLIELNDLLSKINSLMFGSFIVFHFKDWSGKNGELLCYLLKHEYRDCFSVFLRFLLRIISLQRKAKFWVVVSLLPTVQCVSYLVKIIGKKHLQSS